MTYTTKPLTADEIAKTKRWLIEDAGYYRFMRVDDESALRLIATIEQRDEQIGKLREVVKAGALLADLVERPFFKQKCNEALAETEPKP